VAVESRVIGERLADLGAWEMYRFAPEDGEEAVCTVALLPASPGPPDAAEVAYAVFRGADGEPSASGTIARDGATRGGPRWDDEARCAVLEEILLAYRPRLPALKAGVVFDIAGEPEEPAGSGR
jgi:hypothetical protein